MFVFPEIWRALFFRNTRFEIHPFVLPPTICGLGFYLKLVNLAITNFKKPDLTKRIKSGFLVFPGI